MQKYASFILVGSLLSFACNNKSNESKDQGKSGNTEVNNDSKSAVINCELRFDVNISKDSEVLQPTDRIGAALSYSQAGSPIFSPSNFLNLFGLNAKLGEGDYTNIPIPNVYAFTFSPSNRNKEMEIYFYSLPRETKLGFEEFKTCTKNPNSGESDPIFNEDGEELDQSEANCLYSYQIPNSLFLKQFSVGKAVDLCGTVLNISVTRANESIQILGVNVIPQ